MNPTLSKFVRSEHEITKQEFLFSVSKALASTPTDIFGTLKHNRAHLLLAKINSLKESGRSELIPYFILKESWAILKLSSLIVSDSDTNLETLLEIFNVKIVPSTAEAATIGLFEMHYKNQESKTLQEVNNIVEMIGLYNLRFAEIYNYLGSYLLDDDN